MHNALTDNYFVVSLVYSGRGGEGSSLVPRPTSQLRMDYITATRIRVAVM